MYRGLRLRYHCDRERLPSPLADSFVELSADDSTRAWINRALSNPQSRATSALRDLTAKMVGIYDANGITGAYQMRVMSTAQWTRVVGAERGRLLDVGAGDGEVTAQVAALYDELVTTEMSTPMAKHLRARGWRCHEKDVAVESLDEQPFDVVSLLNVIDRTPFPLSLLDRAAHLLRPGGRLVLAVPMPLSPVVFVGPNRLEPEERLPPGRTWEEGVAALWNVVLEPRGWRLQSLARVPYLCRGDARNPVDVLDDAVFVCRLPQ